MGAQKTFALILGMVLLLVGLLGFISDNGIVGEDAFFGSNATQNILHLIAGAFGVYAGTKGRGQGYNSIIGWIGVILGVLGFIPGITEFLAKLLMINTEITILHLVIGVISLLVYFSAVKE